jgi:RNA polymerase sigma-54 factor
MSGVSISDRISVLSDASRRPGLSASPSLRVRQSQVLALTPSLRQSLAVLAMPSADLADLIAAEAADNPVLRLRYRRSHARGAAYDYAIETVAASVTLGAHLRAQLAVLRLAPRVRAAANLLTECLTPEGYLSDPIEILADRMRVDADDLTAGLEALRSCEPAGIGAQDLRNCLELQLIALGESPDIAVVVVANLLALSKGKSTDDGLPPDLTPSDLARLRRLVKGLDPRPGARFDTVETQYRIPDCAVRRQPDGTYAAEYDNAFLPEISVDPALAEAARTDAALGEAVARARALIRAVDGRQKTVRRIIAALLTHQAAFFDRGPSGLRPITQAELAGTLGLHPSTLTRAIAGKSLACDIGLFPLSYFFSRPVGRDGGDAMAPAAIQSRIARLIRDEDPDSPLTDQKIAEILAQTGVDIARRTVAKYRGCLNISPASERRKSKTVL